MRKAERRWMWKRALSMLLVCAMLFTSVDLTALAEEPEVEITTPDGENGTTENSGITDGTSQNETPDNEEDKSGEGTDGEQNPGEDPDASDVTNKPGADDGEGMEEEGKQETEIPDEENKNEAGQPGGEDDSAGDGETGEDTEVNDGTQEPEESVSENSVSENSVSENSVVAFVRQSDLSVEAANGLGSLLMDDVQIAVGEAQSAAQTTCDISEITVEGSTANVRLRAAENCTVVVSIYGEDSERPLAFGRQNVQIGDNSVNVQIETDNMPEYFVVKGHIVDTDSMRPLSKEYKSSMYTKKMQDFLKMTTDDFNTEQVVNLDEDKRTNFVVVKDGNKLVCTKEENGSLINELISYDEEKHTYIFANIDETFAKLEEEDIFVCQKEESDILIVKVKNIVFQQDEEGKDIVVITAYRDELGVDDVFSYVKIEETTGTADVSEIDPATCPEGVTYRGRDTAVGYAIEGDPTVGMSLSKDEFDLELAKVKEGSLGPVDIKAEGKITVNFGMQVKLHYYFGEGVWDVDLSITGESGLEGEIKVEGEFSVPLTGVNPDGTRILLENTSDIFTIKYAPDFVINVTFEGNLNIGHTVTIGIKFGNLDPENNGYYEENKLTIVELEADLDGYIGFDFNPTLIVNGILSAELKTGIHAGIKISASGDVSITTRPDMVVHECGSACLSGEFYIDVPLEGELQVLKFKEYSLDEFLDLETEGSLIHIPLGDFYYSIKYEEFGWGKCPHKKALSSVRVIDSDGKGVAGVTVRGSLGESKKKTDNTGYTELTLREGKQNIYVEQALEPETSSGDEETIRYSQEVQLPEDIDRGVLTIKINLDVPLVNSTIAKKVYVTSYSYQQKGVCYAAIMKDGSLYMWGDNDYGQLGIGTTNAQDQPVKILDNVKEFQFSQDGKTCAAITKKGELYMWGDNDYGLVGNGSYQPCLTAPFPISIDKTISKFIFSPDNDNSAAITSNHELYMWGNNSKHQISKEDTGIVRMPQRIMGNVEEFVMDTDTCAAITTVSNGRKLYLWGFNVGGVAGKDMNNGNIPPEVAEAFLENVNQVTIQNGVGAALTKSGNLYMWGVGYSEKVDPDGKDSYWVTKKEVDCEGKSIRTFSIGSPDSKAITTDGTLYEWKDNSDVAGVKKEPTPIKVKKIEEEVAELYEEGDTSAIITEGNQLFMSGDNSAYQLGNGTLDSSDDWVAVLPGMAVEDFEFLADGKVCAATVRNDTSTSLWTWGSESGLLSRFGGGFTPLNCSDTPEIKENDVAKIIPFPTTYSDNGTYTHMEANYALLKNNGGFQEWSGGIGTTREGLENIVDVGSANKNDGTSSNPTDVRYMIGIGKDGEVYTWKSDSSRVNKQYFFGPMKIFADPASVASECSLMDITEEMSVQSSDLEEASISTYSEPSSQQAADFTNLLPNELYNVYAMKSREVESCLEPDNLLYIGQSTSDGDGNLHVSFEMKEAYASPAIFCVGFKRTDVAGAEVTIPDIVYDGNRHIPDVTVTYNGQVLRRGVDYRAYLDAYVEEIGEYELTVKGIGLYCGEKKVLFRVVAGTTPGDPDDPTPDPIYGDVLPEDVPADGVIPEGLWIAGVAGAGYDYTGKVIKPEVRVYDHKTLLKEKTDYTIAYKNNTKAYCYTASDQEFAANKAPTITVTGKGNYTGKETQTFTIRPLDISVNAAASDGTGTEVDSVQPKDNVFAADNMTIAANKKNQKPIPVLLWNDKKLKNNTDYTVTYYDSTGAAKLDYVKEAGSYYIELAGKGNFTGTRRVNLTVTGQSDQLKLMSKMTVAKIPNQPYTGSEITPALTVKDGKTGLKEGEHYTVSYSRNTEVGTAYAVVTGIEEKGYSGTKRVSFKIMGGSVSKATVKGLTGQSFLYGGVNQEPELTVSVKTVGVEKTLQKGTDYKLTWQKNCDAGTATVTITGVGGYTGTLKKNFKIQAFDISANADGRFTAALAQEKVPYAKGGTKPEVSVTFLKDDGSTQKLKEGKDYTLSYRNHTAPNDGSRPDKLPTVTIKGKGNFKGTYGTKLTYQITTQDLGAEGLQIAAADKTYQNKKNVYTTKVTVIDRNGKALKAGTDYNKILAAAYAYKNDTTLDNGTVRTAGTTVDKNDIIPAGTVLTVTVNGKGNYTGSITGEYRITQAAISSASVTIPKQTYTGAAITLDKSQITVKVKGKPIAEDQYEIVAGSYKNNVKKGTASVTIRGVDNYGGTKTVKFTIKAKGFLWWWR